nr:gonadotropin-releasing hormone I, GnRH I [Clarias gariepinus=African catfish, brain, Peptide, 10 aa] [Clarias gariepinus]
EHWSHGLNPG